MLFSKVPWKSFGRSTDESQQSQALGEEPPPPNMPPKRQSTQEKTLIVHRPRRSMDSIKLPSARSGFSASEDNIVIQRPRRNSSVILPAVENEITGGALQQEQAAEEAVADPGLTVELDLSEEAVGLRGREEAFKMLETALEQHLSPQQKSQSPPRGLTGSPTNEEEEHTAMTAVLVSGASGTGKTCLIRQFASMQQHKILFGMAKYDQFENGYEGPYGILLQALEAVVQQILQQDETASVGGMVTRRTLQRTLDDHLTPSQRACILELIPAAADLWGHSSNVESIDEEGTDHSASTNPPLLDNSSTTALLESPSSPRVNGLQRHEAWEEYKETWHTDDHALGQEPHFAFHVSRVTLALRAFLDALAETDRPLVLFLDDLQYADTQALVSISTLLREYSAVTVNNTRYFSSRDITSATQASASTASTDDSPLTRTGSNKDISFQRRKKNLLFIGAYRSEDTEETGHSSSSIHNDNAAQGDEFDSLSEGMFSSNSIMSASYQTTLKRMEWLANNLSSRTARRIHLDHLGFESTHEIINSALRLDGEHTQSLADVVYRKTNGNPYFVLRYLEMLHRERLLFYSFSTFQWQWNLDLIQTETNVTDNVVDLLSRQVERLDEEIQAVLRLAACLGFYFDIVVLREIVLREGILSDTARNSRFNSRVLKMKAAREEREKHTLSLRSRSSIATSKYGKLMGSRYDPMIWQSEQRENEKICAAWLVYVLGTAEREGLVERASSKQFKFSHDRVQRCLYDATPPGKQRDLLHLRIGRLVRDTYLANLDDDDPRSQNAMLYFAVEQLNMSSVYIKDDEERIGLVELNLEASDKAGEHLTFLAAARFLRKANALIEDKDWENRYDLCLEVFSAVAEVEHSCGNSPSAMHAVDVVLAKARTFEDKIRCVFIKVNDLGVQGRLGEAIKEGCEALEYLGEGLPAKLGSFNALKDILKTNKALKKMSKNQLLNLPEMIDPSKLAAMRLLNSLSLFAWHAAEESLLTVIFLRLMSITLRYGQNESTPFTFATFAMLLAAHGDASTSSEFGQLALDMLQRSKSLVALPRTHLIIYTFINHIRQPLLHGVEPLLNAHRIGLESGELEYGSLCVASYASLYVIFGLPLPNFSADMRTISEQLHHFHQNVALASLLPWWQFGMNLMGDCDDVLQLSGEAMDEGDFQVIVAGKAAEATLIFVRLMLFYLFDELEQAMELYEKLRDSQKLTLTGTHYINHFQHCYCGLLNLSLARTTGKLKYKRNAKTHITELDKLVKSGAVNCQPMLVILRAEEHALLGNRAKAKESYDSALSRCARSGFVHLQAITNEKAGLFMFEQGDSFWAATYLSQALRNYAEWGASAKVQSLLTKCSDLGLRDRIEFSADSPAYTVSLKGRTRFKATPLRLRASF